jgi:hypothetical protein
VSADASPDELRAMAIAIDSDHEPRIRLDADLSAEATQRLHDILTVVVADLSQHAGIETTWPLHRLLAALEAAA